jgi:hypothetical protein
MRCSGFDDASLGTQRRSSRITNLFLLTRLRQLQVSEDYNILGALLIIQRV